jgi:hypothetical protein
MDDIATGLIPIRYHKDTTQKALERWEYIETMFKHSRSLREAYRKIQKVEKMYADSLEAYVDNESNRLIRKINEFCIEAEHEWKYRKAIKNFSKAVETFIV